MKFGQLFEFQKIPEWYCEYLDYKKFVRIIEQHQDLVKAKHIEKINGIWYMTSD